MSNLKGGSAYLDFRSDSTVEIIQHKYGRPVPCRNIQPVLEVAPHCWNAIFSMFRAVDVDDICGLDSAQALIRDPSDPHEYRFGSCSSCPTISLATDVRPEPAPPHRSNAGTAVKPLVSSYYGEDKRDLLRGREVDAEPALS